MSFQPYNIRAFQNAEGWEILVGLDDASNDYLSLKLAMANDLWFHVSGVPGSHVVLRCHPDSRPPKSAIRDAAALAAWFSKMRSGGNVTVHYCPAKQIRKRRGSPPGQVTVGRYAKIQVRPRMLEN